MSEPPDIGSERTLAPSAGSHVVMDDTLLPAATPPASMDDTLAPASSHASVDATLAASADPGAGEAAELLRGAVVGRYVVLGKLGAGGMGVVYAAYDPELDRKVAVKLLRAEAGAASVGSDARARLLREAQALARLGHPNVVAVHDVGAVGERVWLAMEFVEGQTLGAWSRPQRGWREVLAVMQSAGRGLQAAHEAGLVHRDFKPDNVMVAADGRVRVMDLGLARRGADADGVAGGGGERLADGRPGHGALALRLTQAGAILGTPAYMAPEQFEGKQATAAADVFAFSLTFWEALYGERPFAGETVIELVNNMFTGKLRPPPRGTRAPKWLRQVLERGLLLDIAGRWPSMQVLLAALERGQKRARVQVAGAALLTAGALAGGGWAWQQAEQARRVAACEAAGATIAEVWNDTARARVRAALLATGLSYAPTTADKLMPWLDRQAAAWQQARAEVCMHSPARSDELDRALWCLDERRLELESLVGELARANEQTVQRAVPAAAGLERVQPCQDAALLARSPLPPTLGRPELRAVRAELAHAGNLEFAGEYAEGLKLAQATSARAEALGFAPLAAAARFRTGRLLQESGRYAEAETALEGAYFQAIDAGATGVAADAAVSLINVVGYRLARTVDGRRWSRHAETAIRSLEPEEGLRAATRLLNLATVDAVAGDHAAARALFERSLAIRERSLGPEHLEVARALNNLGLLFVGTRALDEARPLLERALHIRENALGPDHPEVSRSLTNLASVSFKARDLDAAQRLFERALAINERAFGEAHPEVATSLNNLAGIHLDTGALAAARPLYERALAIWERSLGPEHPDLAVVLVNLADIAAEEGDRARAVALHERALKLREAALGPDHADVASLLGKLAGDRQALGEYDEAHALYQRALRIHEHNPDSDPADTSQLLLGLGEVALARRDQTEARRLVERAEKLMQTHALPAWISARAQFLRARTLVGSAGAQALALQARDAYRAVNGKQAEVLAIDAWLAAQQARPPRGESP